MRGDKITTAVAVRALRRAGYLSLTEAGKLIATDGAILIGVSDAAQLVRWAIRKGQLPPYIHFVGLLAVDCLDFQLWWRFVREDAAQLVLDVRNTSLEAGAGAVLGRPIKGFKDRQSGKRATFYNAALLSREHGPDFAAALGGGALHRLWPGVSPVLQIPDRGRPLRLTGPQARNITDNSCYHLDSLWIARGAVDRWQGRAPQIEPPPIAPTVAAAGIPRPVEAPAPAEKAKRGRPPGTTKWSWNAAEKFLRGQCDKLGDPAPGNHRAAWNKQTCAESAVSEFLFQEDSAEPPPRLVREMVSKMLKEWRQGRAQASSPN